MLRCPGGNKDMERTKGGGLNTKIHLAVDVHGMPIRVLITSSTTADCSKAEPLIAGINAYICWQARGMTVRKL